jgi:hypothetical protein
MPSFGRRLDQARETRFHPEQLVLFAAWPDPKRPFPNRQYMLLTPFFNLEHVVSAFS